MLFLVRRISRLLLAPPAVGGLVAVVCLVVAQPGTAQQHLDQHGLAFFV